MLSAEVFESCLALRLKTVAAKNVTIIQKIAFASHASSSTKLVLALV